MTELKSFFLPLAFFLFYFVSLHAQVDSTAGSATGLDSVSLMSGKIKGSSFWSHDPHSVTQAALFSAVIPGLGQAYNGKYWKIPIVYAALGTAAYFVYGNSVVYHDLKDVYLLRTDGDSTTSHEYVNVFGSTQYTGYLTDEYLLDYIDQWKRYTDINVIVLSFIYLLNVVDAIVDAHLYDFDVSEDLTLGIDPVFPLNLSYQPGSGISSFAGINIKITFK